jgi:hypothetical protein
MLRAERIQHEYELDGLTRKTIVTKRFASELQPRVVTESMVSIG